MITFCEPQMEPLDNVGMLYIGNDVTGTVDGGSLNYCMIPGSAYRSVAFSNIYQFHITFQDGSTQMVYCMEKGVRGPTGDPYQSMPITNCLPNITPSQSNLLAWIIANSYPAVSPQQLFQAAGVSGAANPALNENDAYAATQVALWSVFSPPGDTGNGWQFLDCTTGAVHPKSDRMRQITAYLYTQAQQRAPGMAVMPEQGRTPSKGFIPSCCRCVEIGGAVLMDCGADDMRCACGKWLYGPLMVKSGVPFELCIAPLCEPLCLPGFITLADACGNPIHKPRACQEFYIAFPQKTPHTCFQLSIGVQRTIVTVAILCNTDAPPHLQTVSAVPRISTRSDCASLCVCFAPPCCAEKCCVEPPPEPCCPYPRINWHKR